MYLCQPQVNPQYDGLRGYHLHQSPLLSPHHHSHILMDLPLCQLDLHLHHGGGVKATLTTLQSIIALSCGGNGMAGLCRNNDSFFGRAAGHHHCVNGDVEVVGAVQQQQLHPWRAVEHCAMLWWWRWQGVVGGEMTPTAPLEE